MTSPGDQPRWYDGPGGVGVLFAAALILELLVAGCGPQDWAAINDLLKPFPPDGALVEPDRGAFVDGRWLPWPDYCGTYYDQRCPR